MNEMLIVRQYNSLVRNLVEERRDLGDYILDYNPVNFARRTGGFDEDKPVTLDRDMFEVFERGLMELVDHSIRDEGLVPEIAYKDGQRILNLVWDFFSGGVKINKSQIQDLKLYQLRL